jgi:LysM repeat protein
MKSKNMDSSYSNRSKLAKAYGIENYEGTASQNLALLSKLKSGVKPAKVDISKLTTKTPPPVQKVKPVDNEIKVDPKVLPKTHTKTVTKLYTYKVKSGDSLWKIAKSKHTTVSVLVSLNKMKHPNVLKIGQVIKYPTTVKVTVKVVSSTPSKKVFYTVKRGDFVGKIASKYHVSITKIKSLNHLNSHYTIYVGEKLRIK